MMLQFVLISLVSVAVFLLVRYLSRARSARMGGTAMLASAGAGEVLPKFWPFPAVFTSAFMLAWATEIAQFFVSRGLAIALLALLEVLPEFSVEAAISYNAVDDPAQWLPQITANFTGANRLLVGLGIPLVFFLAYALRRREGKNITDIRIEPEGSVEVTFLFLPTAYSFIIVAKGTLGLMDTLILAGMYAAYLYILYRLPAERETAADGVPGRVMKRSRATQVMFMATMFTFGTAILYLSIGPFVENTRDISILLLGAGSTYFFFQWIAPLLSESPELLTVSYWVKRGRESSGMLNVVSSKVNQWTLLIAMIPAVYTGFSLLHLGIYAEISFDQHQRLEVLLTAAQSLFAAVCLAKLRVVRWEFTLLFSLWAVQVFDPLMDPYLSDMGAVSIFGTGAYIRELFTVVYFILVLVDLYIYRREITFLTHFRRILRTHVRSASSRTR